MVEIINTTGKTLPDSIIVAVERHARMLVGRDDTYTTLRTREGFCRLRAIFIAVDDDHTLVWITSWLLVEGF